MKKVLLIIIPFIAVFLIWRFYQRYVPIDVTKVSFSEEDVINWQIYSNDLFGFELRYPKDYSICENRNMYGMQDINAQYLDLCVLGGKSVIVIAYRLEDGNNLYERYGGEKITLMSNTTVSDISDQFLELSPVRDKICYSKIINKIESVICTSRASGDSSEILGDNFRVVIWAIYESKTGEHILIEVSNKSDQGVHVGDHALQRDMIKLFHTVNFENPIESLDND